MSQDSIAENFRLVNDFPDYRVSNWGRVQSFKTGQWVNLKPTPNIRFHYLTLILRHKITVKRRPVHKLVAEAFLGPCPPGMEVCHWDGNKQNNKVSNLRYDTRKNNHADKKRHGTDPSGMRHGRAKLTDDQVREIRRLRTEGVSQQDLARQFGVCRPLISYIEHRKIWDHI